MWLTAILFFFFLPWFCHFLPLHSHGAITHQRMYQMCLQFIIDTLCACVRVQTYTCLGVLLDFNFNHQLISFSSFSFVFFLFFSFLYILELHGWLFGRDYGVFATLLRPLPQLADSSDQHRGRRSSHEGSCSTIVFFLSCYFLFLLALFFYVHFPISH